MIKNSAKLSGLAMGLLIILTGLAMAGDRPASRTAMAFLNLGLGPRAYGMGEAFSGLADDINTIAWNPAGLGQLSDIQLEFMHNQWIANLRQEYLALAYPFSYGCGAIRMTYLNSDIQLRRDEDGLLTGEGFNPYSASAGLGWGMNLGSNLFAGVTANYAREQLDDVTYSTAYMDLGGLYRPQEGWWSVGLSAQNLGLPVAGYPLPWTFRLGGAAYLFEKSLMVNIEMARTLPGWFRYGAGAEYWYQNLFAIRAGYLFRPEHEGLDVLSGFRAGLGFNIQGYQLDYAFIPQGDMGFGHRASFTYFFGGGRALASEKEVLIASARKQGKKALKDGDYLQAVDSFQKVLTFIPDDKDARSGLDIALQGMARQEKAKEAQNHFDKADNYRKNRRFEDAMEEYQRVLLIEESNTRAARALEEVKQMFTSQSVSKHLENARKFYKTKVWMDALLECQAVLAIDPKNPEAKEMLDKSSAELAKGGKDFKDPRIKEYYLAGLKRFEQGDYRGAMANWAKVLTLAPNHEEARKYMQAAMRLLEEKVGELLKAGQQYLQDGDQVRAAACWRKILELSPQHPEAIRLFKANDSAFRQKAKDLYLSGIQAYTQGYFKQAIASWKDVLTLVADYPGAADNIEKARQKIKAIQ